MGNTVEELGLRLNKTFEKVEGSRRACVAVLLRTDPTVSSPGPDVLIEDTQVFFILRAQNDGDRWGGQVGLPGGRQERGESDLETVAREVWEEVGLGVPGLNPAMFPQVDTSGFQLVGRIHDRKILGGKDGLVVCSFVFQQTCRETPPLVLDQEEVAACGWFPISGLLSDACAQPLTFDLQYGTMPKESPTSFRIAKLLGLDRLLFTKVELGTMLEPLYVAGNLDDATGELICTRRKPIDPENEGQVRASFFLWGLTLSILNDMLHTQGNVRKSRISLRERVPLLQVDVDRVFESSLHNALLFSMRSVYERLTGEPMPWHLYVRYYPLTVFGAATGIVAVSAAKLAKHLSRL